jgi:glycosyltransferase involved in cell wall biosynthesis
LEALKLASLRSCIHADATYCCGGAKNRTIWRIVKIAFDSIGTRVNMRVHLVLPAFNERPSLELLSSRLVEAESLGKVTVVSDGSTDLTVEYFVQLSSENPKMQIIDLGRNRGKAIALRAGFDRALQEGADVVIMMDADGQDDPSEIPRLLEVLERGEADLVTGARANRQDNGSQKFVSRIYNKVTSTLTGTPSKDLNSGLKAMRAEVAAELIPFMYGEMHRYITVIAHWRGLRVKDVDVVHHPRTAGESKYNSKRFWRGFVDLLTIRFLLGYSARPNHLFAGVGIALLALGAGLLSWMAVVWLGGNSVGDRPALLAGVFFSLAGVQIITMGLLAELFVFARQKPINGKI